MIESIHFSSVVAGDRLQPQELGIAADHRQRPADLVHDPGQQSADLRQLLVEHGQSGHLPELDQATDPAQDDRPGGILGHVIVRTRLDSGQDIRVIVTYGQHQDGK